MSQGFQAQSARPSVAEPDVPFQKFILPNGLTVIVHEDHKAPIVAVNIWYHVGSKNERPGRTGFAHLFEHLMFQSSEHNPGEYINTLERFGVTEFNGTTWYDRTNYFQNVPTNALDAALWLESDRMGHLLGAVYGGDPAYYKNTLSWIENASIDDVTKAARAWLSDGKYALEVHPFPQFTVAEKGRTDRRCRRRVHRR